MTNYRITTPVKDFTGEVAGVAFAKGVGTTSNPAALNYFRTAGYGVDPVEERPDKPEAAEQEVTVQPPAKSASKTDWVEFAVKHRGDDQAEAEKLTHAQLVAAYGPKEEQQ